MLTFEYKGEKYGIRLNFNYGRMNLQELYRIGSESNILIKKDIKHRLIEKPNFWGLDFGDDIRPLIEEYLQKEQDDERTPS